MQGMKFDSDKPRYDLLPLKSLEDYVKVLTHGAKKYEDWNWKIVVKEKPRKYYAAALRHIFAWARGEELDEESGLPHLAHAMCCLAFLLEGGEE